MRGGRNKGADGVPHDEFSLTRCTCSSNRHDAGTREAHRVSFSLVVRVGGGPGGSEDRRRYEGGPRDAVDRNPLVLIDDRGSGGRALR